MKALPLNNSFYFLNPENKVVVNLSSGHSEILKIKTLRKLGRYALVSFYGVNTPETALHYRGSILCVEQYLLPALTEKEYSYEQIIGLTVLTTEGNIIGRVSDIFETGSNDVYVVKGTEKEYLIPAIHDVIRDIQLREGRIIIQVIDGLLD